MSSSGIFARQHGLQNFLKRRKIFKLICGAGNQNLEEIEKLVALYSKAGCYFFDFAADEEILRAAQKGLDFSIPKEEQKNYHFCISIGTKGDQHVQKVLIDEEKCIGCAECIDVCSQKAINEYFNVVKKKCIGCLKCQKVCKHNAIKIYSYFQPFNFSIFRHFDLSCIELHASDTDETEVDEIWNYLNKNFEGMLSLCLGRQKLSNEQILNRIKRLIKNRDPYTTIIQADGSPMSGGEDDYKTTLQAVAMAELIQNENLLIYLMLSGGTNPKTAELAGVCGVDFNGIAVGSYARKIVREYIEREDFFENKEVFDKALKVAKNLVGD